MKGAANKAKESIEEATTCWEHLGPLVLDSLAMSLVNLLEPAIIIGRYHIKY